MKERCTSYLFFVVGIGAFGGFLYGYHTGIIAGALLFLTASFHLSVPDQGVVVSMILLGGLIGALMAGVLADKIGRRRTLALTSTLFVVGAAIIALCHSYELLLLGRFISGVGVGIISLSSPLYLAEISPPHHRGSFVSLYQLAITLGILASFATNYLLEPSANWRGMFAFGIFPALFQMLALFFLPETPAWLFKNGKEIEATDVLKSLRKDKEWLHLVGAMKQTADPRKKGKWKTLFSKKLRFVFVIGVLLSAFQQITGINTVIFYAPKIFEMAGFGDRSEINFTLIEEKNGSDLDDFFAAGVPLHPCKEKSSRDESSFPSRSVKVISERSPSSSAILATLGVGIINVLATLLSVWLLSKFGRRTLLLIGLGGMALSLALLSLAFFTQSLFIDKISILSLMAYVSFFAIGPGPITSVLLSEIYPLNVRGKAMTIALFINWVCNYFVSLTFLDLIEKIGPQGVFLLYTLISGIAFWFIHRFIFETRNKSLEEIEALVLK